MKPPCVTLAAVLAAGLLAGCGQSEPQADASALEAAFQAAPAAATEAEAAPAEPATPAPPTAEGPPVEQLVGQAVAAMRKDEVSEAMVLLQTLRASPRLTADQLTAVQDTMAAMQMDLARRADAGDARAKQALELLGQRTRWQ